MELKDCYTKEEAIKAILHERERWDNDLIFYATYTDRVLRIIRATDDGEDF